MGDAGTPDRWVEDFDRHLTRVSRTVRSSRLHQKVGQGAKVQLPEHLHMTLAIVGAGEHRRVSDIAAVLDVERSTISRRIAELVELGLVVRDADQTDRRAASLRLTPAGRRAMRRIQSSWFKTLDDVTSEWSEARRVEMLQSMASLADELESFLDGRATTPEDGGADGR
jgi:DNA-binding MarR family transcriptional regulator